MTILEAREVSYHYGGVRALQDVDLAIDQGTVHGLIGPNGAGKSTFIDTLTGQRKPTSGRVLLGGRDITNLSIRAHRRAGVARSFQRTSIFGALSVREQLDLMAHQLGEEDLSAVIDTVGLREFLDHEAGSISYGDQRRLDIALALLGQPHVLLLDEPMAGLSIGDSAVLAEHLRNLANDRGVTILLIEHDLEVVSRICDVVTVLDQGRSIAHGSPKQVLSDPLVIQAYVGEPVAADS